MYTLPPNCLYVYIHTCEHVHDNIGNYISNKSSSGYAHVRKGTTDVLYNDKVTTPLGDITVVNMYAPDIRGSTYIKQVPLGLKGLTDHNALILEDFQY